MDIKNKLFLFDIDDTVAVTSYRWMEYTERYMQMHGYRRTGELTRYGFEKSFDIPPEEVENYRNFMDEQFPYGELEPVPSIDRVIRWLLNNGAEVRFVTNRSEQHRGVTKKWIKEKLGVARPLIYFTSNSRVDTLFFCTRCDYLIDNSLKRFMIAQQHHRTVPILSSYVGIDTLGCSTAAITDVAKKLEGKNRVARAPQELVTIITQVEREKEEARQIQIGDYVKISTEKVFKSHPHIPTTLKDKLLRVIDLYREPGTNRLLRVSVTCEGVDNPRSKYNCFYFSGYDVEKVQVPTTVARKEDIDKAVAEAITSRTFFIVLNKGLGVRQVVPVQVVQVEEDSDWVQVKEEGMISGLMVRKDKLFETEEEAYQNIKAEG